MRFNRLAALFLLPPVLRSAPTMSFDSKSSTAYLKEMPASGIS